MGAVAMFLAIICYIVFIPRFGVGGVVIGFTVHEITHALFYYIYFLPKKFGINTAAVFSKAVLPVWILFGGVSFFASMLLKTPMHSALGSICMKTIICIIVFFVIIWSLLFSKEDKCFVHSFLNKKHKN